MSRVSMSRVSSTLPYDRVTVGRPKSVSEPRRANRSRFDLLRKTIIDFLRGPSLLEVGQDRNSFGITTSIKKFVVMEGHIDLSSLEPTRIRVLDIGVQVWQQRNVLDKRPLTKTEVTQLGNKLLSLLRRVIPAGATLETISDKSMLAEEAVKRGQLDPQLSFFFRVRLKKGPDGQYGERNDSR